MRLTYIFHSGFVLETEQSILVFDYWMDPSGVMERVLQSEKPMYVFASHFHEDHFNRDIFEWKKHKENVTYILSKDILRHRRAAKEEADVWLVKAAIKRAQNQVCLSSAEREPSRTKFKAAMKRAQNQVCLSSAERERLRVGASAGMQSRTKVMGASWSDERITVKAMGSTDSGVSWIVETEGKRIFHAGDLGNWYARFLPEAVPGQTIYSEEFDEYIDPIAHEKQYLGELKDIRKVADSFDIAMLPVDGRIGNGYTLGGRQFIERFKVGLFVPMHFVASGFKSAWRMKEFTDAKGIPFWKITREGETIEV